MGSHSYYQLISHGDAMGYGEYPLRGWVRGQIRGTDTYRSTQCDTVVNIKNNQKNHGMVHQIP